jgi:transcription antitermination factor NusG
VTLQNQSLDNPGLAGLPDSATAVFPDAPCGSDSETAVVIKFVHGGKRPGAGRKPADRVAMRHDDEPRWYCVRTLHNQDIRADIEIRLLGVEVFAPTIWKPPVPARRLPTGAMRPAREATIRPLFSRYLFARFNVTQPGWRAIRGLPGVEAILSADPETPIPVPETALEVVRSLCAPNGCVYPPDWDWSHQAPVQKPLAAGCQVRLLYGPLADHVGICQISDGRRVQLLMGILSRSVRVTVNQTDVEELTA